MTIDMRCTMTLDMRCTMTLDMLFCGEIYFVAPEILIRCSNRIVRMFVCVVIKAGYCRVQVQLHRQKQLRCAFEVCAIGVSTATFLSDASQCS